MLLLLLFLLSGILAVTGQSAPGTRYIAEVYFVVDPQVLRNYINLGYDEDTAESTLRGDINFFIFEINKYFVSMETNNMFLEVRSKRLDLLTTDIFEQSQLRRGTHITGSDGLTSFKDWLRQVHAHDRLNYDVAVLWTGYTILGRSGASSINGFASSRSACNPERAAAFVEFDGTQVTAYTTAHEITHTLGSSHDSSHACPPFIGYIMTSLMKVRSRRRWQFSRCSVDSIKRYIRRLDNDDNNCLTLTQTTTAPVSFDIASQTGRDILDVKKICERKKRNPNAYFCGFHSFYEGQMPKGDLVCQYIYCGLSGSRSCSTTVPTEGMVCDLGKRCDKGRCVPAPNTFQTPTNIAPDCVFGDVLSGKLYGFRGLCDEYLEEKGLHKCYRHTVRQECCASCTARRYDIPGCAFGDYYKECGNYTPSQICPGHEQECCYTCSDAIVSDHQRNWNSRSKRSVTDDSSAQPRLVNDGTDDDSEDW